MSKCARCGDGVFRSSEELMKTYGWYSHYIMDDPDCPFNINYHTHGFQETYGHLDMQICFPLSSVTCHNIMGSLHDLVKTGKKFEEGDIIGGIIKNFDITFLKVLEGDREVLRIIFPDEKGNLIKETISSEYAIQWDY